MIMKHLVVCPLRIILPRATKKDRIVYLNLNTYRNLHYQVNNQVKKKFKLYVADQVLGIQFKQPVRITYTLHTASHRKVDLVNICCVVSKFFEDTLVELGSLKDDNTDIIPEVIYRFGSENNKDTARCEALIEEL